jgi:hypothetical protein
VAWSDETKINRLGSDGRKSVWRKQREALSHRLVEGPVKFDASNLMMWGCILWEGLQLACKKDGKMGGNLDIKSMEDELGSLQ